MIIQNYWNSVWRNLMKRKGFSFINIFGLAVGMASALLIFTYVAFGKIWRIMSAREWDSIR